MGVIKTHELPTRETVLPTDLVIIAEPVEGKLYKKEVATFTSETTPTPKYKTYTAKFGDSITNGFQVCDDEIGVDFWQEAIDGIIGTRVNLFRSSLFLDDNDNSIDVSRIAVFYTPAENINNHTVLYHKFINGVVSIVAFDTVTQTYGVPVNDISIKIELYPPLAVPPPSSIPSSYSTGPVGPGNLGMYQRWFNPTPYGYYENRATYPLNVSLIIQTPSLADNTVSIPNLTSSQSVSNSFDANLPYTVIIQNSVTQPNCSVQILEDWVDKTDTYTVGVNSFSKSFPIGTPVPNIEVKYNFNVQGQVTFSGDLQQFVQGDNLPIVSIYDAATVPLGMGASNHNLTSIILAQGPSGNTYNFNCIIPIQSYWVKIIGAPPLIVKENGVIMSDWVTIDMGNGASTEKQFSTQQLPNIEILYLNAGILEFQVTTPSDGVSVMPNSSSSAIGDIYEINWGDGTVQQSPTAFQHTYATAGNYTISAIILKPNPTVVPSMQLEAIYGGMESFVLQKIPNFLQILQIMDFNASGASLTQAQVEQIVSALEGNCPALTSLEISRVDNTQLTTGATNMIASLTAAGVTVNIHQ